MKKTTRRKRGGASCLCPKCRGNSRVLLTRRADEHVWRKRQCVQKQCKEVFETEERKKK